MGIVTVFRAALPAISSNVTDDMLDTGLKSNTENGEEIKNARSVADCSWCGQRVGNHGGYRGTYLPQLPLGYIATVGEAEKPVKRPQHLVLRSRVRIVTRSTRGVVLAILAMELHGPRQTGELSPMGCGIRMEVYFATYGN